MMDRPGIEAGSWSNPELVHVDYANNFAAAEPEPIDTSTVDPSHIIHLIRQLLPNGTRMGSVLSELLPVRSEVVPKSNAVEGVFSGNNRAAKETFSAIDGRTVHHNGSIQAGQMADDLSAKQAKATDETSGASACASASTGMPTSNIRSKEGPFVSYGPSSPLVKNGDGTAQNGNHIQENGDLSRKWGQGGGKISVHNGDTPDWLDIGIGSVKAEGNLEDKILDVPEVDCARNQVESDARQKTSGDEAIQEEAGCVLWDLAASESHAEFLVGHHILDVLLAILCVPHSDRMKEICLGVLGNLACHSGPVTAMVATVGLVETIVQQLFLESVPSLTETCRLLSAGLHSEATITWVENIKPDMVVERIMWMAANSLDSQLLEKCTELILVMVDSRRDAAFVLLPSLLRLGLPGLLRDLIAFELTMISEEASSRGDVVLDTVLQVAEAISISDDSASQLAANDQLFSLTCQVIRLSARDEIGPSAITATVLIANLLTEESGLIEQIVHDAVFVGRLVALVPCTGEDPGARNALWSILGRLCHSLVSTALGDAQKVASGVLAVLADGCSLLLEDLEVHQEDDIEEDERGACAGNDQAASTSRGVQAKLTTVGNMMQVMELWTSVHAGGPVKDMPLFRSVRNARLLLRKHISGNESLSGSAMRTSSGPVQSGDFASNVPASTADSSRMPMAGCPGLPLNMLTPED